jgi:uncharacterized membrane protein YbaN (DUF454 family)
MSMDSMLEGTNVGVTGSRVRTGEVAVARPSSTGSESGLGAEGRVDVGAGVWIQCDEPMGEVTIHDPRLFCSGREAFCRAVAMSAVERFQARRVVIDLASSTCHLEFEPGAFNREELARRIEGAVRSAIPVLRDRAGSPESNRSAWIALTARATEQGVVIRRKYENRAGRSIVRDNPPPAAPTFEGPKGSHRLVDLAMAGGSFTMVVAAVILPGIPTFPFLVMTARHTVRLSPRIERILRRRAWSAALLCHAEEAGDRVGCEWQALLKMVLVTVLAAAVLLIVHPPLPVMIALEIAVLAFVLLRKLGETNPGEFALAVAA